MNNLPHHGHVADKSRIEALHDRLHAAPPAARTQKLRNTLMNLLDLLLVIMVCVDGLTLLALAWLCRRAHLHRAADRLESRERESAAAVAGGAPEDF